MSLKEVIKPENYEVEDHPVLDRDLYFFASKNKGLMKQLVQMENRIEALEKALVTVQNVVEGGVPDGRIGKLLKQLGIKK